MAVVAGRESGDLTGGRRGRPAEPLAHSASLPEAVAIFVPGAELGAEQVRELAAVVAPRGRLRLIDANRIDLEGLPGVIRSGLTTRLQAVGLVERRAHRGLSSRVITHPMSGLDTEELLDVRGIARDLADIVCHPDAPPGGRTWRLMVDGRERPSPRCWFQNMSFVARRLKDQGIWFHWFHGGRLGRDPRPGQMLPVLLSPAQVSEVVSVMARQGLPGRMQEDPYSLRVVSTDESEASAAQIWEDVAARLSQPLKQAPLGRLITRSEADDQAGWFTQKQKGRVALRLQPRLGRLDHRQLTTLANLIDHCGDGTCRLSWQRGIVLPNLPDIQRDATTAILLNAGFARGPFPVL